MNLMFYLNFLNDKIKLLTFTQKVQLYCIPFFLSIFMVYNFVDFSKNEILKPKKILEKNDVDLYVFLKDLQTFTKENNVNIVKTKQNKETIDLSIEGSFENALKTLYFCETYKSANNIKNLIFDIKEDVAGLTFETDFSKYKYDFDHLDMNFSNIIEVKKIKEVDQKLLDKTATKMNEDTSASIAASNFELTAIIDNTALLNDIWIKENDIILKHKVLKIGQTYIELQNLEGVKITLKLWETQDEQ